MFQPCQFTATLLLLSLIHLTWCSAVLSSQPNKPNVIVVFVDDLGYADLGCQGILDDVLTPHIDVLAASGARMTSGYITAPQCSPSRAGLLTGRYQQRFGFDHIGDCPLPLSEITVADRLQEAGYRTGMIGKWHLEPNHTSAAWIKKELPDASRNAVGQTQIPFDRIEPYFPSARGFADVFKGEMNRYHINYDRQGNRLSDGFQWRNLRGDRLDIQSEAAIAFIDLNHQDPFFLYLAYFAPHVPLESSPKYLARFTGEMPERRRMALAMMAAVDDGVGSIREKLREHGIEDNTLIVFVSDNGAPIKIDKKDVTLAFKGGAWDGSVNDPLNGEKGTLLEGGIRVPFVVSWPGKIPGGQVRDEPVISLDVAATALSMAGLPSDVLLDGIDLIPLLTSEPNDEPTGASQRSLYWRFWGQAAIRNGPWKYLRLAGGAEYLFNLENDLAESKNLVDEQAAQASALSSDLDEWLEPMPPSSTQHEQLNHQERAWFKHYLGWQE